MDRYHSFHMDPDECYYLTWEHFNYFQSISPQQYLTDWTLIQKFNNGLTYVKQLMFNDMREATSWRRRNQGSVTRCLRVRASREAASSPYQELHYSSRATTSSITAIYQVIPDLSVTVALKALAKDIKGLKVTNQRCEMCKGGHNPIDCPVFTQEHVDFVENHGRGSSNVFKNSYNQEWMSHPNVSCRFGGNSPGFRPRQNLFSGGDASVTSGSSSSDKKIEEMLATKTQMLSQLIY